VCQSRVPFPLGCPLGPVHGPVVLVNEEYVQPCDFDGEELEQLLKARPPHFFLLVPKIPPSPSMVPEPGPTPVAGV